MAKKRRVMTEPVDRQPDRPLLDPSLIASGFLGATVVYLAYYPSDAASVESGDALWFCMLALATALFTFVLRPVDGPKSNPKPSDPFSRWLDVLVWALAVWMMVAALANSSVSNLRMGTNEAWVWIAGAALFTSVRRLADRSSFRQSVLMLTVLCATGLSVHSLHQEFVTLPQNRLEFEQDPERVLSEAGYDAPLGSAERAIFAGRLYDGGPTGTFALANSLAGVLIAGMLLSAGTVRFTWRDLSLIQCVVWLLVALVCTGGLLATRSRSAVVATLVGLVLIYLFGLRGFLTQVKRRLRTGGVVAILSAIIGAAALIGNREWLSAVPTSLAFRFQYWRTTLQMVWDRPLFGAGPGHFQSVYERYREASTSEQIADPHNFIFETLGSGGWIGLILLTGALIMGVRFLLASDRSIDLHATMRDSDHGRAIWIGAGVSLASVWLFGFATRQLPDVSAAVYVLPVVGIVAWALIPTTPNISNDHLDLSVGITLSMVMLHLMVSGGWTVPGVAIVVWIYAAVWTRTDLIARTSEGSRRSLKLSVWGGSLSIGLLALLYFMSLRPVETVRHQLSIAQNSIDTGQFGLARRSLENASAVDRWSPEAEIGLANLDRWDLVQSDRPSTRLSWTDSLAEARKRGGEDPALLRVIGSQQLHLYQRYGKPEDLAAAAQTFETAVQWSPVNQWLIAQLASIEAARGNQQRSQELARLSRNLSNLGVNVEREFGFQMIYPALHYGDQVKNGPIRRSAPQVLFEPGQAFYRRGRNTGIPH
jgi:O-antigen ligase